MSSTAVAHPAGELAPSKTAMSSADQAQHDYDASATKYGDYTTLPSGILEAQLVAVALGDCTGLKVLDLGGGSGVHARRAIGLGAQLVDVVDISEGMLEVGRDAERRLEDASPGGTLLDSGRKRGRIRYLQADVAQSLSHLPLLGAGGYDVVMGNWIFSFADTLAMVGSILANITTYLRPGGRFVCVRDADPWSPALAEGKYGGSCHDVRRIPGGVRYRCVLHSSPPLEFEGACLEAIYSGNTAVFEGAGLRDVRQVPYESAEVVRADRGFWGLFLEHPNLAVVHATKAMRREMPALTGLDWTGDLSSDLVLNYRSCPELGSGSV
ncbi:S-adenosyl-L-methionine-dependent methyltransferase [Microdochium bolleyi]|uniref:S-adenosyl-L-methionine-dependent methyltransferase n=1 Tax=Microdochium bolleyi TaxID=196109 RepID=A0A136INB8_9PEZI|nr:S-adenosyl-L-methionine-dependent methyltransferase [Microdochium bolleyi]